MGGWLERSVLLGLGVLTITRDRVKEFVGKLVESGEVKAEEAPGVINRLVAQGEAEREELRRVVREEMDRIRASLPVVSRKDIEELGRKIDELTARIDDLAPDKAAK
jgi:polyhydroxyalkanoate synthesis regulator phasin